MARDERKNRSSAGASHPGATGFLSRRFLPMLFVSFLCAAPAAHAVSSGAHWEAKANRDPELAAPAQAVEDEDWAEAVSLLSRVVERRPWDDDAHTLLGYAYRKRGDHARSLEHFHRALALNPYHLGAMEYLGEAYVETGRLDEARGVLERIEAACRRTSDDCEERRELAERIEAGR